MISEAVTLPQIRRGIIGKEKEIPVIESDKEWYEEHKSEILSTLEKALNVDDKTLKIKLQKFDTDKFFTNDRPRKLKVKELVRAVRKNFISEVERSKMSEDKTTGFEDQYEMAKMKNGVEVYAVYTPLANRYLAHTKLKSEGSIPPQWCIASSSAANHWSTYFLYLSEYPSVFIVAQKNKSGIYNPMKYQIKCGYMGSGSLQFKNGKKSLENWISELRDPKQDEENCDDTSLFKNFDITLEELEEVIRKLVNTEKAKGFSKKYGREMIQDFSDKIKNGDEDTKMKYLIKACKNGLFWNYTHYMNAEYRDFFLDELIRYETLDEDTVEDMELTGDKKAILSLIKMKRCSIKSLEWSNQYFDNNMVKRVYLSLSDEILTNKETRNDIIKNIENIDGLTENYVNYLISNDCADNFTLQYIKKDDVNLFRKCVNYLISKCKCDNYCFRIMTRDVTSLKNFVNYLISKDKLDGYDFYEYVDKYLYKDKEIIRKCVDYFISKNEIRHYILESHGVAMDSVSAGKCVDYLLYNDEFECRHLYLLKNNKRKIGKCMDYLLSKDKFLGNYLSDEIIQNNPKILEKCVDYLISKDNFNFHYLNYLRDFPDLYMKCLDYLKSKDEVDDRDIFFLKNKIH